MNLTNKDQTVYQAPAIVFESTITTRAGSEPANRSAPGVDLFGN